jgi:hypothetical protein
MRLALPESLNQSLQALFPLPKIAEHAKNFFSYANSFSFSVWKPKNKELIAQREQVISFYMAQEYYWKEFDTIVNDYRLSKITNEALTADILRGDLPYHKVPKDDHYWNSLCNVTQTFAPPHKIRPVSFPDLRLYPWNKSTNVEAPFSHEAKYQRIKQKMFDAGIIPDLKNSFSNFQDIVFYTTRLHIHIIKNGKAFLRPEGAADGFLHYFTLHAKAVVVPKDKPDKIRTVFGAPKTFIFAEAMFFWPLFAHYMNTQNQFPILWNYAILSGGWLRLNAEFQTQYLRNFVFMFDLSIFDKRAIFDVFDDITDGWTEYFTFDDGYQPTINNPHSVVAPERLHNLWNWINHARKHMPLLFPDGRLVARLHRGVPSGLFTTQFLDSVYNAIMICTVFNALGISLDITTMLKLMGDDSIGRTPVFIQPNLHDLFKAECCELFLHYFDAVLNPDKSKILNRIEGSEVLSYINHNGFPYRDEIELAARFFHTKSNAPTPDITMSQCIGTAYALADPDTRLYRICRSVYTHYENAGFHAAPHFDPKHFYVHGTTHLPTTFPTPEDILARLTLPSKRNEEIAERHWPRWFFLNNPSSYVEPIDKLNLFVIPAI